MKSSRRLFRLLPAARSGALALLLIAGVSASSASASGAQNAQGVGEYAVQIRLPGGFATDLTVLFDQINPLTPEALQVSARLVSPFDPDLASRLPAGGMTSIPVTFPVLVTIESAPGSTLSMRGAASVEFHTENLPYTPGTRLRLFSAAPGEPFRDRTAALSSGSLRSGARTPDFYREDYLILLDQRSGAQVVDDKVFTLRGTLNQFASEMSGWITIELNRQLDAIEIAINDATPAVAAELVDDFVETVSANSGMEIPDVWAAGDDAVNVAGTLVAEAATLYFSLREQGSVP